MRLSDIQAQLQEGIQLAQAGQRTEARRVFEEIVQEDPNVALAWLWLATVSTDREERIQFLERTLILEPENARAQEAYTKLTGASFTPPEVPPKIATGDAPRSLSLVYVFVVVAVIAAVIVSGLLLSGALSTGEESPTPTPVRATMTPSSTAGPSPTATWTPLPTNTPGPSPTSIWDVPPPTWTPSITRTPLPTATPRPTSTPIPTRTATPTITPDVTQTAEFALTSDGSAVDSSE